MNQASIANNIELEIPKHISVLPLESTVLINRIYSAICYKINLQNKQGVDLQSTILNGLKRCLQSTNILQICSTIYTQYFGQIHYLHNNNPPPRHIGDYFFCKFLGYFHCFSEKR